MIVPLRRRGVKGQEVMKVSNVAVLSKVETKNLHPRLGTMAEAAKWGQKCHIGGWIRDDPVLVGPEPDPMVAALL